MPPEVEWFANLSNAHTRRVYQNAIRDFMRFAGIEQPEEFRTVTRAHIIAWYDELMLRGLGSPDTLLLILYQESPPIGPPDG